MPEYIIALPTFNEIESVGEMIRRIKAIGKEVMVIDNDSKDGTVEEAKRLGIEVIQRGNYGTGYGAALRKAMDVALEKGYNYLGFLDCDGTYSPEMFEKLEPYMLDCAMVSGARPMASIQAVRRLGNYLHTYACRIIYMRKILDFNSGMRIIRIDKFRDVVDAPHFGMIAQMTSLALRNKYQIMEVPVTYDERKGESKLRMRDGMVILGALLRERFKPKLVR